MVEYIGARKIMKSQHAGEMDMELLTHLNEEIRHAWLVKRLAQQIDKSVTKTYARENLLCGVEAEAYIQELDMAAEKSLEAGGSCTNGLSQGWLNYLYTSQLIEERAQVFYAAYSVVLDELGIGQTLQSIMRDESKHLAQMAKRIGEVDLQSNSRLAELRRIEESAFGRWVDALWNSLENG
tara:strand:- start:330 stop:872 length:543 start_codon:yes stop_codon:yes gene_type:complete